jgi:peptide/nickel transport system permease protein
MTTIEPNGPHALDSTRGPDHDRPVVGDVVADPEPMIFAPRRRADLVFWLSAGWLGLMVLAALFATRLPLDDINKTDANHLFAPISWTHLMGTDSLGHDLFSQVVQGARISILIAVSSVLFGLVIGGTVGIVSGYARGVLSAVLMWFVDVLLAFPALVFALAIVSFVGQSLRTIVLVISVLAVPAYARVARALTLTYTNEGFVSASRAMGASHSRVVLREVLPNVIVPLSSFAALGAAIAIIAEGALAFLGLSDPSSVSWGNMIAAGQSQLADSPLPSLAPMLGMFLTILALNLLGERLGAVLDPREGQL